MAATVDLVYKSTVTATETLDSADAPASSTANRIVTHNGYNTALTLSASTTPPVTKVAAFSQALTGGAATIDLTALDGTIGTVDGTGLKLQVLKLKAPTTNTATLTATKGASNGYGLDSAGATWTIPLAPGAECTLYLDDDPPDISSTVKNIDLSGTGTESIYVEAVLG